MRNLAILVLLPLGAYLALCVLLFAVQRSQIYFPVPESDPPGAQSIRLKTAGAELKIWVERRPGPLALIYFGGNAEDVAFNLPGFRDAFPDHSLYLVNYRGYGGSSGRPSETVLVEDAAAVFDHVAAGHREISVIGRSLGSGVAMQLAARRPVRRLALVTPFDSLVNVARAHFAWLPVGLLMLDRYDSAAHTTAVRAPVLIVIAGDDEIIPRERSQALVAAFAPGQAVVLVLEGAMHNSVDFDPRYADRLAGFLREGGGLSPSS